MQNHICWKEGTSVTRTRKTAATLLLLLLLCNLCFIWGNSLASKTDSRSFSVDVMGLLPIFIQNLFPDTEQLLHLVRKMAHFTEFACLGGLSAGLLAVYRKVGLHPVAHLFAGGFLVAAIDETIQIYSNRGSQLQDVWLDFAGFSAGLLVVLGIRAIVRGSQPVQQLENIIPFPEEQAKRQKTGK